MLACIDGGRAGAARADARERCRLEEMEAAEAAEIAILDPDIDRVGQRSANSGDRLPRGLALAVAKLLEVGIADAAAGEAAPPTAPSTSEPTAAAEATEQPASPSVEPATSPGEGTDAAATHEQTSATQP